MCYFICNIIRDYDVLLLVKEHKSFVSEPSIINLYKAKGIRKGFLFVLEMINLIKSNRIIRYLLIKTLFVTKFYIFGMVYMSAIYIKGGMGVKRFIIHANGNKIFKKLVLMVLPMVLMIMMITPSNDAFAAGQ